MRTLFACAALAALAACNSQEPAAPAQAATPTVAQPAEPALPAPDEATFAAVYAEACSDAPKVSTSVCKSLGLGKEGFTCDYGLGDDEYARNHADLVPADGKWTLAEPEKICAADAA